MEEAEQLREVLSSPELLDPALVLDATIGIVDERADADATVESLAPSGDVSAAGSETQAAEARGGAGSAAEASKEKDLELTREAIMRHLERGQLEGVAVDGERDSDDGAADEGDQPAAPSASVEATPAVGSVLDNVPSISKILRYTIPAVGIWLCSPVLSMIDTAAVGMLSGTAQQAALNPAVSVTDYGALVVAFMYTATTNLIAAAVQEDREAEGANGGGTRTRATLVTALKLAVIVGSFFGALLGATGERLLRLLIGNDSLDPAVFSAALTYVRIRALGMPAMVTIGTAQSACLGMQDVRSPLYVLLAAAFVNFMGDVALVPMSNPVIGGAAGAAWATVASQYAALAFFGKWLTTAPGARGGKAGGGSNWPRLNALRRMIRRNREIGANGDDDGVADGAGDVVDVTQGIMELTGTSRAGRSRRKEFRKFLVSSKLSRRVRIAGGGVAFADADAGGEGGEAAEAAARDDAEGRRRPSPYTRGFLAGLRRRSILSLSRRNFDRSKAREFLPFVVPVTTTSVGRISGYIAMSHVASSTLGTRDMAGHQIIFSIFCCLTPLVDALSQVAQSFVPAVFEAKERSRERALALRRTVGNFRKVGFAFGALMVGLVACIPRIAGYFTTDPAVMERVSGAIPGLGAFLLMHALMCAGEGTMLGQKDLKFLRNMYAVFFFAVPAYMLRLKRRALAGTQAVSIGTMWAAFSAYNLIRTSAWHLRLAQLQRRTDGEAVAAEANEGADDG